MKKLPWLFALIIFLGASAQSGYACLCSNDLLKLQLIEGKVIASNKLWLDEYDGAIFTGQVINLKKVKVKLSSGEIWHNYQVTFKVDKYWKGGDSSEVIVFTGVGGGDCGIHFHKGENYIVFAQMIEGRLQTNICSYTAESRYAGNIIKGLLLGDGKQPTMPQTSQ